MRLLILILCLCALTHISAQQKRMDSNGNEIAPYYVDITATDTENPSHVFEITNNTLDISYHDFIGKEDKVALRIYNWKKEAVYQFNLQKEFGLNYFHIEVSFSADKIIREQVYLCELLDESGQKHTARLRWINVKEKEISANIIVNPKFLECSDEAGNLVEFYGQISGGKAPYQVNWYVMNDHRTDFLYQPKTEKITDPGYTSSIQVDKAPDYYVMMYVKDACGNEQKQTVNLTCKDGQKKINTLFIEPLDKPAMPVKTGN